MSSSTTTSGARQGLDATPCSPYYADDWVTIYHADAREVLPMLKDYILVTDPPYGVNLGKHKGAKEKRSGYLVKGEYDEYDDTPEAYSNVIVPILEGAIAGAIRSGVFGVAPKIWELPPPDAIGGAYLPAGCGRTPWGFQNMAPCLLYGTAPNLHKGASNTILRSTQTAEKNGHPCPKPLEWMSWLIGLASEEGDLIVDPFMGSGTTLRAAKDMNRRAVGIDLSERYCAIAAERMSQEVLNFTEANA